MARWIFVSCFFALLLTPSVTAAPAQLTCPVGQITWLSGTGTPHTALLIWWRGHPVGGGSVNSAGLWALPLAVGNERPGVYPVEVWERGTRTLLGSFTCAVGVALPIGTPVQATPPPAAQDFDHNGDGTVTCADFTTQAEARAALAAGYTNLDTDSDDIPCESLPVN